MQYVEHLCIFYIAFMASVFPVIIACDCVAKGDMA